VSSLRKEITNVVMATDADTQPVLASCESDVLKERIPWPSSRAVFALVCSLGFFNIYALRANLSVALVAMVNSTQNHPANYSSVDCPGLVPNVTIEASDSASGEFSWNNELQGYILASFFYGYISTQLLGGRLAELVGAKYLFGGAVFSTAALTLLTPLAARSSPYLVITLRVLEGVGEGASYPAMHCLLGKWAPPKERSKLGTFIYAGAQLGTVISMLLSAVISENLGWEWVFYIFGSVGCAWFLFYVFLVYESPAEHPRISEDERAYISKALGHVENKASKIPWLAISLSPAFWGVTLAHISNSWGNYTLLTSLPKYYSEVMRFNLSANAFLNAFPYIINYLVMMLSGQIADLLISRKILSTTVVRKIFTSTGLLISAVCLLAVGLAGCNKEAAVVCLIVGVGLNTITQAGYGVNHIDLAPNMAGTLMGISNTLATVPGMLGPQVVGWLTNSGPAMEQWQKVFYIATGIYVFGTVANVTLASGEQQPWATQEPTEKPDDNSTARLATLTGPFLRVNPFNADQADVKAQEINTIDF